jgi:hypothetical protein
MADALNEVEAAQLDDFVDYISGFDFYDIGVVTDMMDQYHAQWQRTQTTLDYLKFNSVCMRCAPMLNAYVKHIRGVAANFDAQRSL